MKTIKLQYSRSQVNKAGDLLRAQSPSDIDRRWASDVLSNWRAIHNYPINTFQATLRHKLKRVDNNSLVAQRLKRIPSIIAKLKRFSSMELVRMQDIGGLRAVVGSVKKVDELYKNYKETRFQHKLVNEKDYIKFPKKSGYRGIHLIYRNRNINAPEYDDLLIELQLRTQKQHAWATAVETMGIFLNRALKSSEGPDDWLRFFALTGSAFAHLENNNPVPGFEELSRKETYKAVAEKSNELNVQERLKTLGLAITHIFLNPKRGTYYLLDLNINKKELYYRPFSKDSYDIAVEEYLKAENKIQDSSNQQVVLVATESIDNLRRAYPNFFLDTSVFLNILSNIVSYSKK